MKTLIRTLMISAILGLAPHIAVATNVTVIGSGTTTDEAIQDALRRAVEYAAGVYVYSTTTVEDSKLISDKIITASKSLVSKYKVLSDRKEEGLIVVNLVATIDAQSFTEIIHKNKAVSLEDSIKDYNLISNKVEQLQKAAELLNTMKGKPVSDMYVANYLGYDVVGVGLNSAKIRLKYSIARNPFFWDAYYQIVNHLKEESGWFSSPADAIELCLGYKCGNSVQINQGLREYTVPEQTAKVVLYFGKFSTESENYKIYDNNYIVRDCPAAISRCSELGGMTYYPHFPWPLWNYQTTNYPAEIEKISDDGYRAELVISIVDLKTIKLLPKLSAKIIAGGTPE